jgi:hypothetical protein
MSLSPSEEDRFELPPAFAAAAGRQGASVPSLSDDRSRLADDEIPAAGNWSLNDLLAAYYGSYVYVHTSQ